jgi:hypothetical protein
VREVSIQGDRLTIDASEDLGSTISRALATADLYPRHFARTQNTLEDLFLELTDKPSETAES